MDIHYLRNLIKTTIKPIHGQAFGCFGDAPKLPSHLHDVTTASLVDFTANPSTLNHQSVVNHTPLSHVITVMHSGKALNNDLCQVIFTNNYTLPLQHILQKDNGWSEEQFNSIAWDSYHSAKRQIPRSHRISIMKLSHRL
jgi:hypothetical protein